MSGEPIRTDKRLALAIYHVSNARIYVTDPGMNSLILTYGFPLR